MKIKFLFLGLLFFATQGQSYETKCSKENITALLTAASDISRADVHFKNHFLGYLNSNVGTKKKPLTYWEIKQKYMQMSDELATSVRKNVEVLETTVKKYPECEEWSIFKY